MYLRMPRRSVGLMVVAAAGVAGRETGPWLIERADLRLSGNSSGASMAPSRATHVAAAVTPLGKGRRHRRRYGGLLPQCGFFRQGYRPAEVGLLGKEREAVGAGAERAGREFNHHDWRLRLLRGVRCRSGQDGCECDVLVAYEDGCLSHRD